MDAAEKKIKQDIYERTSKRRYNRAKASARRMLRDFTLTFEEYENLIIKNECAYCGNGLEQTGSSLDRIDSSEGYVQGNAVACCYVCNTMKSDLSVQDFYQHLKRILKYEAKRSKTKK